MKLFRPVSLLLLCFSLRVDVAETNKITIEDAFPKPPEPLIDLVLPPTRSKEPYAASLRQVFQFSATEKKWHSIYRNETEIFGIAGYAKNSSVLYVVGTDGLATTRDSGQTWAQASYPDASSQGFVGISVNPTNRREAILTFTNRVLITRDFGQTLTELPMPENQGTFRGAIFAGSDPVRLVIVSDRQLLVAVNSGDTWTALPLQNEAPSLLQTSETLPAVLLAAGELPKQLTAFDLANSFISRATFGANLSNCSELVPDLVTNSVLWAVCGNELKVASISGAKLEAITTAGFETPISFLRAHPRLGGHVLVVSQTNDSIRMARVQTTTAESSGLWGFSTFAPVVAESVAPSFQASAPTLEALMAKLIASEPSLETLIADGLNHARHNPEDIARWQKRARRRNWIPELRVSGGVREYPVDQIEQFDHVDRFGIPQRDDLRLSDSVEPMGYAGVALVWDLSRIFFDRDELEVNQEKRAEMKQRNELIAQITTLYYERLDLLARKSLKGDKISAEDRISLLLKLRQKSELLNHLIGSRLLLQQ